MKTIVITGANGFLGRHTAAYFKKMGWRVLGIGHGQWEDSEKESSGLDWWLHADVDLAALRNIKDPVDCVFHCAGGSTVGLSVTNPYGEFQRTVNSAISVLEYIRTDQSQAVFIYPSSAAVYGEKPDAPISEHSECSPISPYGYYKRVVEELCAAYSQNYNVSSVILRFFSIYGAGLEKQLLWDACKKLLKAKEAAQFFGTGNETRDWLHVKDAASLIYRVAGNRGGVEIINGGSGSKTTVEQLLKQLRAELQVDTNIVMDRESKIGDPIYYWADINKAVGKGWKPEISIDAGLAEYVAWYKDRFGSAH